MTTRAIGAALLAVSGACAIGAETRAIPPGAEVQVALRRRREALEEIGRVEERIAATRVRLEEAWAPPEERRRLLEDEDRLEDLRAQADAARADAIEAACGNDAAAREALGSVWIESWRESIAAGDEARAGVFAARARRGVGGGRFAAEVEARGTVRLSIEPEGASVSVSRYEEEAGLVSGGAFVLVPTGEEALGTTPLGLVLLAPGSYLAVARRAGFEDLRLPFAVSRGDTVEVAARMLPDAATPPGFVFVPEGPFRFGGDPEALGSRPGEIREVPSFWIAREEVTIGEYLEFLNDPETLREIEEHEARTGNPLRAPRDFARPEGYWSRGEDGRYAPEVDPRTPVAAVTWGDATAYAGWKSRRAAERGEPWVFALPREEEWEKAARGVDGRAYPWGNRFDWGYCEGGLSRREGPRLGPAGEFPRDESPYGVRAMSGGVSEWCEEWATEGATRVLRGGSFELASPAFFRAAYRSTSYPEVLLVQPGIRLIARRASDR